MEPSTPGPAPRRPRVAESLAAAARAVLPRAVRRFIKRNLLGVIGPVAAPPPTDLRAADAEVLAQQLLSILEHELRIPPPPPKHLQVRVVGGYVPTFVSSGYTSIAPMLERTLAQAGRRLADFGSILDFGCGCGRAVRALATLLPDARLFGTDIDPEAIGWLQAHYGRFGEFSVAPHTPPTVYGDGAFDLVFGISVFTHLPEEMQFLWLDELRRITRPGGFLVLTTHGEKHWAPLEEKIRSIMETKGFFYSDFGFNYGRSISLPDFYQTAFHSHDYIRREWGRRFDVLAITDRGIDDHQDTVLLRNRTP